MLQQQRFFALKFEDDMSVADFISKVQEQQQTLKRLGEAVTDRMAMSKIIMSLPLKYAHFVSAWESCAEEKQTLDNLTARLLVEEERQVYVVCNGFHVSMTNDKCVFSKNNRVCAIANKESCSKLYVIDFKSESLQANVAKVELSEWHERCLSAEKAASEEEEEVTFVKKHDKPEREEQEEKCIYLDIEENLNNEEYQSESDTEGSVEFEDCQVNDNMMQEVEFLEEEILEHEEIQEVNESMPVNSENTRRTHSRKSPNWFHDYEVGFISVHNEPSTLKEAMECEDKENWIEAMNREITTLK
ncbi:unnamed protein product, partial [Brenthis ino]